MPNPNGYDDFLKSAALTTGDTANAPTLDRNGLLALVSTNSESLRLLRIGLTRQCALPAESAMTNISGLLVQLADLKRLSQLLNAEGRLRELDNKTAEAAQSYVDTIHFGHEISRGGFIINRLVGLGCEFYGITPLTKIAPKLNSQEARPVIAALEQIEKNGVTWDEVLQNEGRYAKHQLGPGLHPVAWVMARWQSRHALQSGKIKHQKAAAHVRLLATELALRCYQSEQGHVPTGLEQLVPKYLQRVPSDPFGSQPLVYRPQGTTWLLYSIGEDGLDDGGKRVGRSVSGTVTLGDVFYDSPY